MSYAIVKRIKISDKVMITSADNNVWPRTPREWECTMLTEVLKKEGPEKLDIELLKDYESGNMQAGGQNKYSRALEVLRHMPEYKAFDWRATSDMNETARKSPAFDVLLLKALKTKLPRDKYIITKQLRDGGYGNIGYFYHRKNSRSAKWYYDIARASVYRWLEDAENVKKYFTNTENWEIKKL